MSTSAETTRSRLDALCLTHPDRHVGGPGVAAANDLFADAVSLAGFSVERLPFECVDWEWTGARIVTGPTTLELHVGPYSPPYDGRASLVAVESVDALETLDAEGAILLFHGAMASEQMTPRNYPFYQTDEHARVLAALDRIKPAAIIAATDRTPMAAALCPFPLFEDADLGFPSAYTTVEEGLRLLEHAGHPVELTIDSRQLPARGEQIVARLDGRSSRRIVISAHIDSRHGTPGALDNAAGVCVLLALADLLAGTVPALGVELVPFNGEDNFAAYGEMAYLASQGADGLSDIALAVNLDAVGRRGDGTAMSFYGVGDEVRDAALETARGFPGIAEGPEWPMSDHMVFAMRGVPAIALTSTGLIEIAATVAHTAADLPELVDVELLVEAAEYLAALIERVSAVETLSEKAALELAVDESHRSRDTSRRHP